MRFLTILLLAGVLLADDKTFELGMLPKPEKGQEEKIEIEASLSWPENGNTQSEVVRRAVLKRRIRSLGEDGLSLRERLTLEQGQFGTVTEMAGGGTRQRMRTLRQAW